MVFKRLFGIQLLSLSISHTRQATTNWGKALKAKDFIFYGDGARILQHSKIFLSQISNHLEKGNKKYAL